MTKKLLIAAFLAANCTSTIAGEIYAGGSVGYSRAEIDCSGASSCGRSSAGTGVFVGYPIDSRFAVEAVYFDLGEAKSTVAGNNVGLRNTGLGVRGLVSARLDADALGYIAIGLNRAESKVTSAMGDQSHSAFAPSLGAGIDYVLNKNFLLRSEVNAVRFESRGKDKYTVGVLSIGLKYIF